MSKLLRHKHQSSLYFITCVTYDRRPILVEHSDLFLSSLNRMKAAVDFTLHAWVILPDHFHLILDVGEVDISKTMQRIKLSFSADYRKRCGLKEGRVWQARFWDHIVRDQADFNRHLDYIHYNPVKHGITAAPMKWRFSSIHESQFASTYSPDWGTREPDGISGDFGE
ncbi:MAG: transposase [candidate division Zixibacteria bacterium]|nr:transposase [candidate division Zixibacteria bacterium]